jgi:hypothetical protein
MDAMMRVLLRRTESLKANISLVESGLDENTLTLREMADVFYLLDQADDLLRKAVRVVECPRCAVEGCVLPMVWVGDGDGPRCEKHDG